MKSRIAVLLFLIALPGHAATLEWKFAAGDEEQYLVTQSARLVDDESKIIAEAKQNLDLTWKVLEVADDGKARISLTVSSYSFLGKGPDGQEVRYDSQSTEESQGYAAMLAPIGKLLAESAVEFTMSPRGEVTTMKLPEALSEAVKSIPGGKKFALDGGIKSFEVMTRLGAPLFLPEGEIKADQEWSETREVELPALGQLKADFQYKITEPWTETEVPIDQHMSVAAAGDLSFKFANENNSGKIVFNIEDGRPETSSLSYEAKLESASEKNPLKLEYSVAFRREADETQ